MAERPAATVDVASGRMPAPSRSLERIFPRQTDAARAKQMQGAWVVFLDRMATATSRVLDDGGPPSEIAHVLTEMVREWFRVNAVTLTDYELRRLVIELLELHSRARYASGRLPLEASPSNLVSLPMRESALPTALSSRAVSSSAQDLIERLWADPSIDAILVDGPGAVLIERNGVIELSTEAFRDDAHLDEIAIERARRSTPDGQAVSAIADFRMNDGAVGMVIFPPVAPRGPVIAVRREEAATTTFERLVARGAMSQTMADLLGLAVRCRLNILISGPASATAGWLGAVGRACDAAARIVSVAREPDLSWTTAGSVALVVPSSTESGVRYPSLIAAGARLRPDFLLLKDIHAEDMPALFDRLSHGDRGIVASMVPGAIARGLEPSFDLSLRLDRAADGVCRVLVMQDAAGAAVFVHDQGRFVRRAGNPGFGDALRAAGQGEALLTILG